MCVYYSLLRHFVLPVLYDRRLEVGQRGLGQRTEENASRFDVHLSLLSQRTDREGEITPRSCPRWRGLRVSVCSEEKKSVECGSVERGHTRDICTVHYGSTQVHTPSSRESFFGSTSHVYEYELRGT